MKADTSKKKSTDPRKKRSTKKIILIILGSIFVPILIIAALMGWAVYQEAREENWFEYQAMIKAGVKSEDLVARGKELGLQKISEIPVYRIDQAKMFGLETRDGGTLMSGCYEDSAFVCKTEGIFIRNGLEGDDLDAILAHEYLHVMYTLDGLSSNKTLEEAIRSTYVNTPLLSSHSLANYTEDERTFEEVFVYACTDAQDKWLSEVVLTTCNKYIDRTKIKLLY